MRRCRGQKPGSHRESRPANYLLAKSLSGRRPRAAPANPLDATRVTPWRGLTGRRCLRRRKQLPSPAWALQSFRIRLCASAARLRGLAQAPHHRSTASGRHQAPTPCTRRRTTASLDRCCRSPAPVPALIRVVSPARTFPSNVRQTSEPCPSGPFHSMTMGNPANPLPTSGPNPTNLPDSRRVPRFACSVWLPRYSYYLKSFLRRGRFKPGTKLLHSPTIDDEVVTTDR